MPARGLGDLLGVGGSMRGQKPVVVTAPQSSSSLEQALAKAKLAQEGYAPPDRPSVAPKAPMTQREMLWDVLHGAGQLMGNPVTDATDAYDEFNQGNYKTSALAALGVIPLVGKGTRAVRGLAKTTHTLRRVKVGDGVAYKIMDGKEMVGHLSGFEKADGSFHLYKTEITDATKRGSGLYQQAVQTVADQYPNGMFVEDFQSSPALKKALSKMPTSSHADEKIVIASMTRPAAPQSSVAAVNTAAKANVSRAIPNMRGLDAGESLVRATAGEHLIRSASGQYVGAPRGVNTPKKLEAMRAAFDAQVEVGAAYAGKWYPAAQEFVRTLAGSDPAKQVRFADELGITSAQADPVVNAGFAITGHNAIEAGTPKKIVRTGNQARAMQRVATEPLGAAGRPKTSIYSSKLVPAENPLRAEHLDNIPTNDIWHFRAFGYKSPSGGLFAAGGTPQMHAFIDAETMLAAERANVKGLGGKTDWNGASIQEAPWVAGKGASLHQRFPKRFPTLEAGMEEAGRGYGPAIERQVANVQQERVPSGTQNLPELSSAPAEVREAYSNFPGTSLRNATGQDAGVTAVGMYADKSLPATGLFTNPVTGLSETNPLDVARPLAGIQQTRTGRRLDAESKRLLEAAAAQQAYNDGQSWHAAGKAFTGGTVKSSTSVKVPNSGPLSSSEIKALNDRFGPQGYTVADHGDGFTIIPIKNRPANGSVLKKWLNIGDPRANMTPWSADLQTIVPTSGRAEIAKWDGIYKPMHVTDQSQYGQGIATDRLEAALSGPGNFAAKFDADPVVSALPAAANVRDAAYAAYGGVDPFLRTAREIRDKGWNGSARGLPALFAARKAGVALPVAAIAAGTLRSKMEPQQSPK